MSCDENTSSGNSEDEELVNNFLDVIGAMDRMSRPNTGINVVMFIFMIILTAFFYYSLNHIGHMSVNEFSKDIFSILVPLSFGAIGFFLIVFAIHKDHVAEQTVPPNVLAMAVLFFSAASLFFGFFGLMYSSFSGNYWDIFESILFFLTLHPVFTILYSTAALLYEV